MLIENAAVTGSAPKDSHRNRRFLGRAKNSAVAAGTKDHFSFAMLSRSTFRTPPSASHRENDFGTQLRAFMRHGSKQIVWILLLLVLLGLAVFGLSRTAFAPDDKSGLKVGTLAGRVIQLYVADTPSKREQGLSGHPFLPKNEGMLFVFDSPAVECFWMKDMRFNLDMLWFDADKRLVYQEQDISPATYPKLYCPPTKAQYVVEVIAGTSKVLGLKIGDELKF